jgi:hypothetical protein
MATKAVTIEVGGHPEGFARTLRSDRWWVAPLLTVLGLSAFGVYTTWALWQGEHYFYGSYLSPFYSPTLFIDPDAAGSAPLDHAWFGAWPAWWPGFLPASPAFFILLFPLAFRLTCYYYRKAYYRSFLGTPPGCSVCPTRQRRYNGETRILALQNVHRYAMYIALGFIAVLGYDAATAFFREVDGELRFGVGVGSIVLTVNVLLIAAYTLGCHSLRHLVGGRLNRFSRGGRPTLAFRLWSGVSRLNTRHMRWAWLSLGWVAFTDLYVRLVSMGVWTDLSTWE